MKTRSEMQRLLEKYRRRVASLETALADGTAWVTETSKPARRTRQRETAGGLARGVRTVARSPELVNSLPGVFWECDCHGIVRFCQVQGGLQSTRDGGTGFDCHVDKLVARITGAAALVRRVLAGEQDGGAGLYDVTTEIALCVTPLRDESRAIVGAVGLCIDVAELRRWGAPAWVESDSAEAVWWSPEQERRRIACEIHDGFVQEATGALMHLESLLKTGRIPQGPVHQELEQALRLVRKAVTEARCVIGGLLPPVLEERGVVAALEEWIAEQAPGGLSVQWYVDVPWQRWEPLVEGMIYRIIQEALTNVRRHSRSARAEVRMTQRDDLLCVEVRDWGVGFHPNGVHQKRFGLRGICERARLLGGRAEIDSVPGKGTRVFVGLPLTRTLREVATT